MAATRDIVATYRGPGRVMRRILDRGVREDRALMILMIGCLLGFVAQTPRLARVAFENGVELNALLGGALFGWIFVAPLALYLIAGLVWLVARLFRSRISGYGARIALFWALLAATPLLLLRGLTAGFIGAGLETDIVTTFWIAVLVWFWVSGLRAAGQGAV